MTAGGEDLLAVDDVVVAVALRRCAQGSEVGPGVRLGVADGEVHVTGEDVGEEPVLLQLGAEALQGRPHRRSEEHTSELQSLMRISYAVFCLKKKTQKEPK